MASMLSDNVKNVLVTSLVSSGFGYIGSAFILQLSGNMPFFGMDMNANVAMASAVGISTFVGEFAGSFVLPILPQAFQDWLGPGGLDYVGPVATGLVSEKVVSMYAGQAEASFLRQQGAIPVWLLGSGAHYLGKRFDGPIRNLVGL